MNKILVIDDEKVIRNSFKLTFENTDCEIDTAENGKIGIEKFIANDYGLVFLDLKMPEMNGVQVLRKIRSIDTEIPVYIITAFHREFFDDLNEARNQALGFELINKPLKKDQLRKLVSCILGVEI